MTWLRNTYLFQLYHFHKTMFWVVVFFIIGTFICTFRGNQTVPFWVWGMYSEKATDFTKGNVLLMFNQSGEIIPIYSQKGYKTRFFLHSPLEYYHHSQLLQNDPRKLFIEKKIPFLSGDTKSKLFINDPELYGNWLKSYLTKIGHSDLETLYILQYQYDHPFNFKSNFHKDTLYVF